MLLLYFCFLFSPSLTSLMSGSVASNLGFYVFLCCLGYEHRATNLWLKQEKEKKKTFIQLNDRHLHTFGYNLGLKKTDVLRTN